MSNALGYLLGVIPYNMDDRINGTDSADAALEHYLTLGATTYSTIREIPFTAGKRNG